MSAFKLDGAKFPDMDSLKEALWELYKDKMTKEEFNSYVEDNVVVVK